MLPDNETINGYDKSVPLKMCDTNILNPVINIISLLLRIDSPRHTGILDNPSLIKGTGTGIKDSDTAINPLNAANNATILSLFTEITLTPHLSLSLPFSSMIQPLPELYLEDR